MSEIDASIDGIEAMKAKASSKGLRYYYRHRKEVLEKQKLKKLQDPEYQAKLKAREEAKKAKEEAKRIAKEEAKKARDEAMQKAREEKQRKIAELFELKEKEKEAKRRKKAEALEKRRGEEPPG